MLQIPFTALPNSVSRQRRNPPDFLLMFHLYQPNPIDWDVSVDLPAKGGVKKTYTFRAFFHKLDQKDCDELQDQHNQMLVALRRRLEVLQGYGKEDATVNEPLPCTYEDLADAVLCGWDNETTPEKMWVVDTDGEKLEFTEANPKPSMFQHAGRCCSNFPSMARQPGPAQREGCCEGWRIPRKKTD
jgi:hypothetical protein